MATAACLLCAKLATTAIAQQIVLQCDRAQTGAQFTLSATLHAVHGSFRLQQGEIRFDPATGKIISGEIVLDAASGETGNDRRDHKMHKDVLESGRYPRITFRPDRVEGKVAGRGTSVVGVHGMFGIHGIEHEVTVPVEVRLEGDRWTATSHFPVPFLKWGLKNPSTLFLHVGDSVDVEFHGAGHVTGGAP